VNIPKESRDPRGLREAYLVSDRSKRSGETKQIPLTRKSLIKLKQKAWRRGIWFRCLKPFERRLLDLINRVVQRVRSFILAKIVTGLVSRLFEAMESPITRLIRTKGPSMTQKLSEIGKILGCKSAKSWVGDRHFMQFLVINNLEVFGE
jgi:hypothetical protein